METVMPVGLLPAAEGLGRWLKEVRGVRLRELRRRLIVEHFFEIVLLSMIIGVVSGLVSIVFDQSLEAATNLFLGSPLSYSPPNPSGGWGLVPQPMRRWLLPLVVGLGGLLSGLLVYKFAPEAEGHGTDVAIACFHKHAGEMRARTPPVNMLASVATIASGGSAGRDQWPR